MKFALPIACVVGLLAGCGAPETQSAAEVEAVAQVLHGTYDRPDSPLSVEPVVIHDAYAIAGWVQGEMGGRALLRKQAGSWSIILCAGDAVKEASYLVQTGMSTATATAIAEALVTAEEGLPAERRAMFSRFGAPVIMNQPSVGERAEHVHAESTP